MSGLFSWTDADIARLRELAAEGLSSRQIAEQLGTTKNSIIGKCRRECIDLRFKPVHDPKVAEAARLRKNARARRLTELARTDKANRRKAYSRTKLPTNDAAPLEPHNGVRGMIPAAGAPVEESPSTNNPEPPGFPPPGDGRSRPRRARSGKRRTYYGASEAHEHLESNQCRWPLGDPKSQDFHFCTADALDGRVYCAEHWKRHLHPQWTAKTSGHAIRKG